MQSKQTIRFAVGESDSSNSKYECPETQLIPSQDLKLPGFNCIVLIIDTSSSTMNTRFDNVAHTTKIIILAELEGIAHHLIKMMKIYDLTGVRLLIYSFSGSTEKCHDEKIKSNDDLYGIIQDLDEIVWYFGDTTDLYSAVTQTFQDTEPSDYLEIIIATDGRTDNKEQTINFLRSKVNFSMFVIGTGSIISSECDKEYLEELSGTSWIKGSYTGAYLDYADLKIASKKFLTQKVTEYVVDLYDGKYGKIDVRLQRHLFDKKCLFVTNEYGSYVIISNEHGVIQFRVNPQNNLSYENNFFIGEVQHTFSFGKGDVLNYAYACNLRKTELNTCIIIGNLNCEICFDGTGHNFACVRQLVERTICW